MENKVENKKMTYLVEKINKVILSNSPLKLKEVGYGVEFPYFDKVYYKYFDYPYSPNVESLNLELKKPDSRYFEIDTKMFDMFNQYKSKNSKDGGYLYYIYEHNELESHYSLYKEKNNLGLSLSDRCYKWYLPLMHINSFLNGDFCDDVQEDNIRDDSCPLSLLYLCQSIPGLKIGNTSYKQPVITCTFVSETCVPPDIITEDFVENLYNNVLFWLHEHFDSPIIRELLNIQRQSLWSTYQHELAHFNYIDYAEQLNDFNNVQRKENESLYREYDKLIWPLRVELNRLQLLHGCIFTSNSNNPLRGKSIVDILIYFDEKLRPFNGKTFGIDISHSFRGHDIILSNQPGSVFNDFTMILISLWNNALKFGDNSHEIKLTLGFINKYIIVGISNKNEKGCNMHQKHIDYLNKIDNKYPPKFHKKNTHSSLELVKHLCIENDWIIKANGKQERTTVMLYIKKHE